MAVPQQKQAEHDAGMKGPGPGTSVRRALFDMLCNLEATNLSKESPKVATAAVPERPMQTARSALVHASGAIVPLLLAAQLFACGSAPAGTPPHNASESAAASQRPGGYAVSWNPALLEFAGPQSLGVTRPSTLRARLDQAWEDPIRVTDGQTEVEVGSCRALLALDGPHETVAMPEFNIYQGREAQCRAAALLARARPSQTSLLHHLSLDARAPEHLPAALALAISSEYEQVIAEASALRKPWTAIENVHLQAQVSPSETRYAAEGLEQTLTIAGRADANSDGIEDLVLLSDARLTEGTLQSIEVFLLTRTSESEPVLRVLPFPTEKRASDITGN